MDREATRHLAAHTRLPAALLAAAALVVGCTTAPAPGSAPGDGTSGPAAPDAAEGEPTAGAGEAVADVGPDGPPSKGVALVYLRDPGSPVCRVQDFIVGKLAREYAGRALVRSADAVSDTKLAARFAVEYVPTFAVLRDGQTLGRMVGLQEGAKLRAALDKALGR